MFNEQRRSDIIKRFENSGKEIIVLSETQIKSFCGNAIELQGHSKRLLALSATAYQALNAEQVAQLEKSVSLLPLDVSAIELAGGSVRSMLAGIHLSKR